MKNIRQLYRLAGLHNVQTGYFGMRNIRHYASADSLLAVLKELGAPVASMNDVPAAIREAELAKRRKIIEPVTVAWNGARPLIKLTLPAGISEKTRDARLELESGESLEWQFPVNELPVIESGEAENFKYVVRKLTLPQRLPFGYHKLILHGSGKSCETLIICAQRSAYSPADIGTARNWGTFLPLYALKTGSDWGSGDYSGLNALADWTAGEGGSVVGTLPLLPAFLDNPYDPSPYAPVSRLLWNEFYVDINKVPELASCPQAGEMARSFAAEINSLRSRGQVDYRCIMSLKRRVMERCVQHLKAAGGTRHEEFQSFIRETPLVEDYARFRAVMEKQGKPWGAWPEHLRDGNLQDNDGDEAVKNYHLYAQWQAHCQIGEAADNARRKGVSLYFDLPLGVHPDGYDVWRYRDIFAKDISTGAPPDPVFTTGQNWGFPPLHPENIRAQGYRYVRDYIRHHMRSAAMLRIDHVMGLHRLYWIPRGIEASQGVYVHYHTSEFYAVLNLESQRCRSVIIGEDLGIVPGYVRTTMARHGLHRMYILNFELADNAGRTPRSIPRNCIASLNTHDMPSFAGFWESAYIMEKT